MKYSLDQLPLTNSFASLGEEFYSAVQPTPFKQPAHLVHANPAVADLLHLDLADLEKVEFYQYLSCERALTNGAPLAMLYAGHQFGHFVPQLGDGRAIMLGETTTPSGQKWELQLKGSGETPYSRQGDGRAVLRSTIREYLCSEAMAGLGIPTTRALAMVRSDEEIYREQIEPGAMLTRVAPSHVRFGSFEVFFYRNQFEHIKTLADYVIEHHYPELAETENPYKALLESVVERTAKLIAQWQAVGFAHGVMNSDNMSILGLTIDYGPFGFMETYEPGYVCNHSDHEGRYAFDQQPEIGLFNLSCLAQALLPLLEEDPNKGAEWARDALGKYQGHYVKAYATHMRAKLGLLTAHDNDQAMIEDLLEMMANQKVDFTILFRRLCDFTCRPECPDPKGRSTHNETERVLCEGNTEIRDLFLNREFYDRWAKRYAKRLQDENSDDAERAARMKKTNPKYILRNYLAEQAIRKAEDDKDYSEIDVLFTLLQNPFDEHDAFDHYANHPPEWANQISVSCSS